MTAILGGIYLITLGKSAQGLTAIIGSLTALTAVFVYGKKKESKELRGKSDALAKRMSQS
jgi:drug/metabolite transporter (DMT)-like permease